MISEGGGLFGLDHFFITVGFGNKQGRSMVKKKGSPVDSLLLPDGVLLFLSQVDQNFKNLDSTCRHFGTGTEYGDSTCVEQELVVLMRNNTTHVNEDVFTSQFLQFCDNGRYKRL